MNNPESQQARIPAPGGYASFYQAPKTGQVSESKLKVVPVPGGEVAPRSGQETKVRMSELQQDVIPSPGGEVPKHVQWEARMNQQTGQETGVKDPSGEFHEFKNGESFAQIKDNNDGERKPFIVDQAGNEIKFNDWLNQSNIKEYQDKIDQGLDKAQENTANSLDKERLNRIVNETAQPGVLYGREVNLDAKDIEEVSKVITMAERHIARVIMNSPGWDKAQEYLSKQIDNGGRMFKDAVINGGSISDPIYKSIVGANGNELPQVVLPTHLYSIWAWQKVVDSTKDDLLRSRVAHGTTANTLYDNLAKLASFVRDNNLI